ncbi:MAG TPA: hypothetical protein VJ276_04915 [Thermoanaerobaculia bacterium]|nr:hypothetical protein [Thermoanaerobaculia bacterium]
MKPIHLNLASRPYRDYRPVYAVVVVTSLLIAYLMLNNIDTFYHYRRSTSTTRADIERFDAQADQEYRRAQAVDAQLKSLNLAALDGQTRFINSQLAQRSFSWSELLDHLENVVSQDVRIVSIAPTFDPSGTVRLQLNCEGKTPDAMVNTLNRFNREGSFANPFPSVETAQEKGGFAFALIVDYRPSSAKVVR